ncbi:diacylglycerol/lipid kinase family protein [Ktedonospora formicarum]|uniref:DAGKc domain-containing protein n=1 Tax=Ktedonospora formicarum TaxID=2778364 RepID=A0A8J3I153_9CHLR|nr:diacylglycerol kinase family protein [Ktedonospora formicarum]GHO44880.1 hypothetical protein KSX_30430 [Ktedonospora formicarum]
MRAILIRNPTSGASPLANHTASEPQDNIEDHILETLKRLDIEPEVRYTSEEDPGEGIAREAARDAVELVIAAGGDGTLHSVATGLIGSNTVLGILPCGTMNNIARSLRINEDIETACETIAHGKTSRIDVGSINGHIFLEVAGIGLEAELFPAAEEIKSPGIRETWRGVLNGLKVLFTFKPERFKIRFDDGHTRTYRAIQISVCNSPFYGARFQFAPTAIMDDGYLNALIYQNFSKLEYILHAIAISQGRRVFAPKVKRRLIQTLAITSKAPVTVHADGEPLGTTPVNIHVVKGALHVRIPEQMAYSPNVAQYQTITSARRV